jgi:serine/threonine protein phosphatase PrpC
MVAHGHYEIHAFACTDIGQVRCTNEDSFVVANLSKGVEIESNRTMTFSSGPQGSLFAVADGMGGAAAGEVASRLCLETLYEEVLSLIRTARNTAGETIERILIDAVGISNHRVFELGHNHQEYNGMGTTLTAAVELQGKLVVGQIGDSRAYLIREDQISQLTRDQSLVAQMVCEGKLTEDQARHHPERHILLQTLGVRAAVELGLREVPVYPGDVLLLCSDGLHSQIGANEICEIVLDCGDVQEACLELIHLANDRGGPDNITCVLVEFLPAAD